MCIWWVGGGFGKSSLRCLRIGKSVLGVGCLGLVGWWGLCWKWLGLLGRGWFGGRNGG